MDRINTQEEIEHRSFTFFRLGSLKKVQQFL